MYHQKKINEFKSNHHAYEWEAGQILKGIFDECPIRKRYKPKNSRYEF